MVKTVWAIVFLVISLAAHGKEATLVSQNPALDARMVRIASELRCLVCQNQTIADSHAGLAIDLRNQVLEMLKSGKSDEEIINYMTARYGDFVLYRPPLKPATFILWFGPGILLVAGLIILFVVLRRRSHLPAEAFDAEETAET